MHIAFVTPRFTTEYGGGLSSYLSRVTRDLRDAGHEVEVFVSSSHEPGLIDFHGITVHRVRVVTNSQWLRVVRKVASLFGVASTFELLAQSYLLCRALEARDRAYAFDAVQYADYLAVGLFMRRRAARRNIVRASTAIKLYHQVDGLVGTAYRCREWLELLSIRRADVSYAPSRFISEYYRDTFAVDMKVIRPPLRGDDLEAHRSSFELPPKYLIHFGQLCRRKGTYWLIEALTLAFEVDPTIRVIMVGQDNSRTLGKWLSALGEHREKVLVLYPLPKRELSRLLRGARATIVPSLVDNLPNAAIESLHYGIPVIGSRGASINELVEEGVTGELAEIESKEALSDLIIRFWQEKTPVKPGFLWSGIPGESECESTLLEVLRGHA